MKNILTRIRSMVNERSDRFPRQLSILLIIFFLVFGTCCLIFLLDSTG